MSHPTISVATYEGPPKETSHQTQHCRIAIVDLHPTASCQGPNRQKLMVTSPGRLPVVPKRGGCCKLRCIFPKHVLVSAPGTADLAHSLSGSFIHVLPCTSEAFAQFGRTLGKLNGYAFLVDQSLPLKFCGNFHFYQPTEHARLLRVGKT
ncbi:hypothetical protein D918_01406 [Trichuris suis]|nr:hypothetical protein D918_01406 [Trichuris suis]